MQPAALQRGGVLRGLVRRRGVHVRAVGSCTLNQVDP
jgi:hypothetical protein